MFVKTFEHSGYTVRIETDECQDNPREWCNLGTMCMDHRRYNLPWEFDGVAKKRPQVAIVVRDYYTGQFARDYRECASWSDVALAIRRVLLDDGDDLALVVPVYMLDHGGLYFSVPRVPFFVRDPFGHLYMGWDSGMVGIIFISRKKVLQEYGWKKITQKRKRELWDYLKAEVETYNQYSTGDVYAYVIEDENGDVVESCGGFYGLDCVEEEAKRVCEALTQ